MQRHGLCCTDKRAFAEPNSACKQLTSFPTKHRPPKYVESLFLNSGRGSKKSKNDKNSFGSCTEFVLEAHIPPKARWPSTNSVHEPLFFAFFALFDFFASSALARAPSVRLAWTRARDEACGDRRRGAERLGEGCLC